MNYCVYKHTAPNGKVYIGITRQEPSKRWKSGLGYEGSVFFNAIKRFGWENIEHEILFDGLTEEEACDKEIELIALYNSTDRNFGYNVAIGGNTTNNTPEANTKRSIKAKEKWDDKEYRDATIEKMKGAKRTIVSRENISIAQKKRFEKQEERNAISKRQLGKKRTEEAKRKTSETLKAFYSNSENASRMAEKHYEANRRTHGRKVRCIETDKIYDTIVDASKDSGIERRYISAMCGHKRKRIGDFTWEYYNERRS